MKKLLTLCLLAVTICAVAQTKKTVAVLEPIDREQTIPKYYLNIVRITMETAITLSDEYEAFDRSTLDRIKQEQAYQQSGEVDDAEKIRNLGAIAGVNYILVPEVTGGDGYIMISAKVMDIEKGRYDKAFDTELVQMNAPTVQTATRGLAKLMFRLPDAPVGDASAIHSPRPSSGDGSITTTGVSGSASVFGDLAESGYTTKTINGFYFAYKTRDCKDVADALPDLTDYLKNNSCRTAAFNENGAGVVITGSNGYRLIGLPAVSEGGLWDRIKYCNSNSLRIKDVSLTNNGGYCIVHKALNSEKTGYRVSYSSALTDKLKEFYNNDEDVYSVSLTGDGDKNFAIVTDKHFYATLGFDHKLMAKAHDLFGQVRAVCTTPNGIAVVCAKGVVAYGISQKLANAIENSISDWGKIGIIKFTDSGTYFISNGVDTCDWYM